MKYCDLHCDALTNEGILQVTGPRLKEGGCLLQCFAAFVSAREGRFSSALFLTEKFRALCEAEGFQVVRRVSELNGDKINALLTVEEGGAAEGDTEKLRQLFGCGVRMLGLTWNYPNEMGYPCFPDYEGLLAGRRSLAERERERGLTPFGFECVSVMAELGMIVDVSHGSDRLFYDVAGECKRLGKPFVASHSGADSVYCCARNLQDGQIKALADCGGAVGLDFCADFLSSEHTREGQRQAILAHARAIVNAGGEDVLAIGSDFDGIPENAYLRHPADMPLLLRDFEREFGTRVTEKIAYGNFLRVLRAVCPP